VEKMRKTDDFYSIPFAIIYREPFFPNGFFGGF